MPEHPEWAATMSPNKGQTRVSIPEIRDAIDGDASIGTRKHEWDVDTGRKTSKSGSRGDNRDEFLHNADNKQTIDLNRPLPALPTTPTSDKAANKTRLQSQGKPTQLSPLRFNPPVPRNTQGPKIATKKSFASLTRDLLSRSQTSLSGPSNTIQDTLDPLKYMPPPTAQDDIETMDAYHRYLSIANSNPYYDYTTNPGQVHMTSALPSGEDVRAAIESWSGSSTSTGYPPMSQSRSEGSVAMMHGFDGKHLTFSDASRSSGLPSPIRGRHRSQSPVKHLDQIQEFPENDAGVGSSKRSKSPMKKMFGEKGWLSRSMSMRDLSSEHHKKNNGLKHLGEKLRQRIGGLTDDMSKLVPAPFHLWSSKGYATSKFPVSLDPPTQSKLYGELELMICATANAFLMRQHRAGRMSVESINKILEYWNKKGRPQVIQFQFDQTTQRELILYNLKSFKFAGEFNNNMVAINMMMYNWRVMAKEMSIRTFCAPDSEIRKHLHDSVKILHMLEAPVVMMLALHDLQLQALKIMKEQQQLRDEESRVQYGVERMWRPQSADMELEAALGVTRDPTHGTVHFGQPFGQDGF